MNFTIGMKCPQCEKQNSFLGGVFGGNVQHVNYKCKCGFSAMLLLCDEKYEGYEIKPIKKD